MMFKKFHLVLTAAVFVLTNASVTQAQQLTPLNIVSNAFHSTVVNGDYGAVTDDQAGAFTVVTNGIIAHDFTTTRDNYDTWESDALGVATDFVGLVYASPARFDSVTVELGYQFGDGGEWESEPYVYLLKNPAFYPDMTRPELISSWVQVPATLTSGHVFTPESVSGAGGTVTFELTGPAEERVGWGWAVGGVDGNQRLSDGVNNFISVTELLATGEVAPAPPIPLPAVPEPINVVTNSFNSPNYSAEHLSAWRGEVFQSITNGVIHHDGPDGYDTWQGDSDGSLTDFVGLQYNSLVEFETITVDLGVQFVDGGDWEATPKVFVLKNPVDTNQTRPETDPANWVEVSAIETTGHVFDPIVVPGTGGTMTFQLTGSAAERTGWGWAVGGVDGNARASDGAWNFISITEVSATGTVVPEPHAAVLAILVCLGLVGWKRRG